MVAPSTPGKTMSSGVQFNLQPLDVRVRRGLRVGERAHNLPARKTRSSLLCWRFRRCSRQPQVESSEDTNVLVILVLDKFYYDVLLRLDLEHLQDETHEGSQISVVAVGSAEALSFFCFRVTEMCSFRVFPIFREECFDVDEFLLFKVFAIRGREKRGLLIYFSVEICRVSCIPR